MSSMEQAIDHVLNRAQTKKLNVEVLCLEKSVTTISVQARKLDQFSHSETSEIGVRVIDGTFEGVAYSESLEPDSLDQMLQDAFENSRAIRKETVSELHPAGEIPTLDFLYDGHWDEISDDDKIRKAADLEAAALDADPRISGAPYSWYRDGWAKQWIANTQGLKESYQVTSGSLLLSCLANDGESKVSAYESLTARQYHHLDPLAVGRKAAQKALARIGARRPKTGRYSVVFENRAAEALIGLISGYFSAKHVDEKTSPLAGRLGQVVFSQALTLVDDPLLASGVASRPMDDEGYGSSETMLVTKGRLESFLTNSVYAKKMNLPHTAHASRSPETDLTIRPSNVVVECGKYSLRDLLTGEKDMILITSLQGTAGFRETSGDFSIPVEGFLYRQGQPQYALKDFLISGNILQVLSSVEAVGNDVLPPNGTIICPSLRVHDLNVSGEEIS